MSAFETFKKFNNPEEAGVLIELLKKNSVDYELSTVKPTEDIIFAGNTMIEELEINIKPEDFEKAEKLFEDIEEIKAESLDKDYYLFEFSNDELLDLLKNPDEWSLNDYHWAREILKQRGMELDQVTVDKWKNARLENLSQTETVTMKYLVLAWFFCLTGGFIGIFMGRHLSSYMKTLPNGQKMYAFDEKGRKLGYRISIAGIVCLLVWIVMLFYFII
jgi:hypothetical protein